MSDSNYITKHTKRRNFTIIQNELIDGYSDVLSAKDKWILFYMLSKPENWVFKASDMVNKVKDGRDAIYAGLQTLVQEGFISRTNEKQPTGFFVFQYHIFEDPRDNYISDYKLSEIQNKNLFERYGIERKKPVTENPEAVKTQQKSAIKPRPENPEAENPDTENPNPENPEDNNTDSSNTDSLYKNYPNFIKFIESYHPEHRNTQKEECLKEWIKQGLENDSLVGQHIAMTKAYTVTKIQQSTPAQYVKRPLAFLKEERYRADYSKSEKVKAKAKGAKDNATNKQTEQQSSIETLTARYGLHP